MTPLPLLLAATLAAPIPTGTDEHWIADFDAAAKVAQEAGKDLLVDFTGSDWCGWCIKLHDEVFQHATFLAPIEERFVLVSLDFPNTPEVKAKVPNAARNQELAEKYSVGGFPTILLMTPGGEVFARTGYRAGGPEKYVEHVNEIATAGRKALVDVQALAKEWAAATGPARENVLDRAIAQLAALGEDSPFAAQLAPIVRAALELDPENKAGRKLKAVQALLAAGIVDDALLAAARGLDPKNAAGLLERVVNAQSRRVDSKEAVILALKEVEALDALGPIQDAEIAKNLYANAAFWHAQVLGDAEKAKVWAKKLQAIAADDERFKRLLEQLLK